MSSPIMKADMDASNEIDRLLEEAAKVHNAIYDDFGTGGELFYDPGDSSLMQAKAQCGGSLGLLEKLRKYQCQGEGESYNPETGEYEEEYPCPRLGLICVSEQDKTKMECVRCFQEHIDDYNDSCWTAAAAEERLQLKGLKGVLTRNYGRGGWNSPWPFPKGSASEFFPNQVTWGAMRVVDRSIWKFYHALIKRDSIINNNVDDKRGGEEATAAEATGSFPAASVTPACRKVGQIEVDDMMMIRDLVARTEFNNILARVIGPDMNSNGRWKVKVLDDKKEPIISVATAKLFHLRPEL